MTRVELISIIVPVYNVEPYLERCVRSLIRQTYANLEIILVDDGSTDNSGSICEALKQEDRRISVIHKANGGLSDARNCGVSRSSGQFITFIDSDDYVADNYIEHLHTMLTSESADIACCGFLKTDTDHTDFGILNEKDYVTITGEKACRLLFEPDSYIKMVIACCKLYKADIVRAYPFPVGRKYEDEATTCKFLYTAPKVVVGNCSLYAYYQNPGSITHTRSNAVSEDVIYVYSDRAHFFEEKNEKKLTRLSWDRLASYLLSDNVRNNRKDYTLIKSNVPIRNTSPKIRCRLLLYRMFPSLYVYLKNR